MPRNPILFFLKLAAAVVLMAAAVPGLAAVEYEFLKSLNTGSRPLDVAVSADGRSVFVLTEEGSVLVFGPEGSAPEKINVGPQAEKIAVSPDGERIYVTHRQGKRVDVIQIDAIREINTAGAPFKGRDKAPVVVAVFSDFQ